MPTQQPFSTQMVELLNRLLDKVETALPKGRITQQERDSLAQLLERTTALEGRPTPTPYNDAPLTARVQALEAKPTPTPYDDTELRGKVSALELREDRVGVSAEEMGAAISKAIASLPPDQVGISEERVQELLAAIHTYDDTALRGRVQALEEKPTPTPYNDTELRGKVVALETLPSGLDALRERIDRLETNGASPSSDGSGIDPREFQQMKAFLVRFVREMLDLRGMPAEDFGEKFAYRIIAAQQASFSAADGGSRLFQ